MNTTDNILINPKTGQEYVNVPPKVAAKYLGVSEQFIYKGLKQKALPFGTAIDAGKEWAFSIPVDRLKIYKNGLDLSMLNALLKTTD